jgi:hypothetical protein
MDALYRGEGTMAVAGTTFSHDCAFAPILNAIITGKTNSSVFSNFLRNRMGQDTKNKNPFESQTDNVFVTFYY